MFPDTLYVSDPADGILYGVDQGIVKPVTKTVKEVHSILVAQNQVDIYTVNSHDNSITRINRGTPIGDIRVGNYPYGICEDPNGILYVTNYSDNTVTVIQNNIPDPTPIPVDRGPRGIISDAYGNIWVACYLSNTVVQIVNRTVVSRIQVGQDPEGITCDIQNNIWVTCSGSNLVAKIVKGQKVWSKETGKRPIAVVTDKNLNVYVANFEDDSVTIINQKTNMTSTVIGVGDGPSAITIDSQNYVYVVSNLFGENIYKINPKTREVIDRIYVCTSPSAFGDFSGCSTFNVFNPTTDSKTNGLPKNAAEFMEALEPTFKIIEMEETSTYCRFKVTSDLLNLKHFDHLKLNDTLPEENISTDEIWFKLNKDSLVNYLVLKGYFNEGDQSPVIFKPLAFRNVFSVKVGMVDQQYDNWKLMYEKVIDFNTHDIVASVVNTGTYDRGHVVCLVPSRIYAISKDYLTVNSGYAFGNGWLPDMATQKTELEKIMNSGVSEDDLEVRTILFNPDETEALSLFFFHFYRIDT